MPNSGGVAGSKTVRNPSEPQPGDLTLPNLCAPYEPRYLADDVVELLDKSAEVTDD